MPIHFSELGLREETFTSVNHTTRTVTRIAVSRLQLSPLYLSLPVHIIDIDGDHARHLRKECGIDQHRLDRITLEVIARKPVCVIEWRGNLGHTVADGTHRMLKGFMLGCRGIPGRIAPPSLWEPYCIEGLPFDYESEVEYIKHGWSGMP